MVLELTNIGLFHMAILAKIGPRGQQGAQRHTSASVAHSLDYEGHHLGNSANGARTDKGVLAILLPTSYTLYYTLRCVEGDSIADKPCD